jgi:hypothetical protein
MKLRTKRKTPPTTATTRTAKAQAPTPSELKSISGWRRLDALKLPPRPSPRHSVESLVAIKALLAMLWLDLPTRALAKKPVAGPSGSLSRLLWLWASIPAADLGLSARDNTSAMQTIWRGYLKLLTQSEIQAWRIKLTEMAMSWKELKKVARWSARVHSRWFHEILAATNRACGKPPLPFY